MIVSKTSQMAADFDNGETIVMSLSYHSKMIIRFISSVISKILSRNRLLFLQETIITILREIIINAVKANSKRLYFTFQNLDMQDRESYAKGMTGFKNFIIERQEFVEDELKKSEYK